MVENQYLKFKVENLVHPNLFTANEAPLSIACYEGEMWCVTGPSGSGKTTLLKIISGQYAVPGISVSYPRIEQEHKHISDSIVYVPQEVKIASGFISDLYYQRRYQAAEQEDIPTVFEILLQNSTSSREVDEAIRAMSLTKHLQQPFVQLSNGQTRRLMIAIALLKKPRLLLLDNPYTGLDHKARQTLNRLIKHLPQTGVTLFMACHQHELAEIDFITHQITLDHNFSIQDDVALPLFYQDNSDQTDAVVIDTTDLKVVYGDRTVLSVPQWVVHSRERWLIRGRNGAGKSTLLSMITADHPQVYSNSVYLFGKKRGSGESIWEIKSRIGYFSSELLRYFSSQPLAEEVIASGWSDFTYHKLTDIQQENTNYLISWLGIDHLRSKKIGTLSFGEQKMILIARAMVRNPELLILDEPLQGMDAAWRDHFKKKIDQFSQNRTVLYVTHDEDEIPPGKWKTLAL